MTYKRTLEHLKPIIQYFKDYTNLDPKSKGFGLTSDHSMKRERSSIAATGFMICAFILGAHHQVMEEKETKGILKKIVDSLLEINHFKGFFPHFLDRQEGTRYGTSEYSTIDTMLLFMGLLALDQYCDDEIISKKVERILDRVDYEAFTTLYNGKKVFAMSYNDLANGDYVQNKPGYIYSWHMYAEQLMMYWLYPKDDTLEFYQNLEIEEGTYKDILYRYSPGNTLFIYHFPLAFLDLKNAYDINGFSPYENAKKATMAHRQLSIDLMKDYKTFNTQAFGFNASDTPQGYRVFHGLPNKSGVIHTDGTVAPFSVVGALPYLGETVWESIEYLKTIPGLYGQYGFMDGFNQEQGLWISDKIISIDKGLELLSFDAADQGIIQGLIREHPRIKSGFKRLNFTIRGNFNGHY